MSTAASSLLRRLSTLAAAMLGVSESNAVVPSTMSPRAEDDSSASFKRNEEQRPTKLVFGRLRHGLTQLATHGSHASHQSHASHYSGSSGGIYTPSPPSSSPARSSPIYSTPTPVPSSVRPAPAPVPVADVLSEALKKLPRIRSRWPKQAKLVRNVQFNMMEADKVVGMIGLNPGTTVNVWEIKPEHAIISFNSSVTPVPVTDTDIIAQLGGAALIVAMPDDPIPAIPVEPPRPKPASANQSVRK